MEMIGVPPKILLETVRFAARHNAAVEIVVTEALRTYMEDVRLGLLSPPPEAPAYYGRLFTPR